MTIRRNNNKLIKDWIRPLQKSLTIETENKFINTLGREKHFNDYLHESFQKLDNLNHSSSNGDNIPSIIFFNISTVELEFKNLNLSILRNKINELKNQFQRLIKKERYWRQKQITLNKIL